MNPTVSRRDFLRVTAAAGGGLLIGFRLPGQASQPAPTADFAPNAFVRIGTDGKVTVIINKAEMGQGVSTSMSMALCEELDADWSKVGFEFAPVDHVYDHPGFGMQMTGGSMSTLAMTEPMRKAGAMARALLVQAAAKAWGVKAADCRTENGSVLHGSDRRSSFGELAAAAAELKAPEDVPLKADKDFKLIGRSIRRLDTPDKISGKATFAIDVNRPGMLVALVAHPPTFGGKCRRIDDAAARKVEGVKHVVDVGSGVAVVATGFWAAKRGRDQLVVDWEAGGKSSSTHLLRGRYESLSATPGLVARKDGDAEDAMQKAARVLKAQYEVPYLAHAPMEPLNCVVDLRADSCDIWIGTQFQTVDHAAAMQVSGLKAEQVKIHTTFLGGGFGRRATPTSDVVVEAVKIAKAVKAPVKMIWTREDDMRSGYYRPMWHSRISAGLDAEGNLAAWRHTIVGQSITAGTPFEAFMVKDGIDGTSVEGAADLPYAVPNVLVDLHTTTTEVPTLWWRSVGHSHTAFVVESFLDEVAHATKTDPLALRRKLLAKVPKQLAVLELAAAKAGWDQPVPQGRARGLAVHHSFNSTVATVLEVGLERGRPRVHKATVAVDCGRTINPDAVRAQLEGAVGFALGTALYSEITLQDGRVQQSNFHDYRLLRINEMPAVEVHMVPSTEPPTGVGEPGVPPVAPALGNALFRLTGKRIRRLPVREEDLR